VPARAAHLYRIKAPTNSQFLVSFGEAPETRARRNAFTERVSSWEDEGAFL
jgi:hypothetical protein